ncbi:UDP-N-acetylglucosamine--LPS N-acetylglucosamine transferase [Aquicoccus sp. SCR17]|nr:UDP-N-acetylglucosamine--LPS N-acetylglucosamine transferase [Carideicomes alvinocaridis]
MGQKRKHVMAVASAGGHWVQLSRLAPAWAGCEVTYVTTDPGLEAEVREAAEAAGEPQPRFRTVIEANRWQKLRLLRMVLQLAAILVWHRPDVVVTTGAAPGVIALRLAALMRTRTVWIDSIANAEKLSLSGRLAGNHADLWLTQWEHLAAPEGPDFRGSVV